MLKFARNFGAIVPINYSDTAQPDRAWHISQKGCSVNPLVKGNVRSHPDLFNKAYGQVQAITVLADDPLGDF